MPQDRERDAEDNETTDSNAEAVALAEGRDMLIATLGDLTIRRGRGGRNWHPNVNCEVRASISWVSQSA